MHHYLQLKAKKIQITLDLKPADHRVRRIFVVLVLDQLKFYPNFGSKVICLDETNFWICRYVNKQNCKIWADENHQMIHELLLYLKKV